MLEEIEIDDFAGSRPPMRSYEPNIANCKLFAFFLAEQKAAARDVKDEFGNIIQKESTRYGIIVYKENGNLHVIPANPVEW